MDVTMPERLLGGREALKKLLAHDVLDAHDLGILDVAVIDHALNDIVVQDRAVVVALHLTLHASDVEVKAIEISIDRTDRWLTLQGCGAGFEHVGLHSFVAPRRLP